MPPTIIKSKYNYSFKTIKKNELVDKVYRDFLFYEKNTEFYSNLIPKISTDKYFFKVSPFEKEQARHNKIQKLVKLVTTLRNYLKLAYDWDGYEGIPPKLKTVEETIYLVKQLPDSVSLPKPIPL